MIQNKRGAHFISFAITDASLLRSIRKALKSNHKISVRPQKSEWKTRYTLQIGSKVMFNDLRKLGLTPRKAIRTKLPNIPTEYIGSFVRGYFDGDGHVTTSIYKRKTRKNKLARVILSGFTSANRSFLVELHRILKKYAHIRGGSLFFSKGHRLTFSKKDTLALYDFLYKDISTDLYLPRKKRIFEKYLRA
jgi:intein-encoded DNA endonuclease-like protein